MPTAGYPLTDHTHNKLSSRPTTQPIWKTPKTTTVLRVSTDTSDTPSQTIQEKKDCRLHATLHYVTAPSTAVYKDVRVVDLISLLWLTWKVIVTIGPGDSYCRPFNSLAKAFKIFFNTHMVCCPFLYIWLQLSAVHSLYAGWALLPCQPLHSLHETTQTQMLPLWATRCDICLSWIWHTKLCNQISESTTLLYKLLQRLKMFTSDLLWWHMLFNQLAPFILGL